MATNEAEGPIDRGSDRRDSPRVPLKFFVCQVEAGGSFEEKTGDLGIGGVFFEDRMVPVGKKVQLHFTLPGRPQEIHCEGEIIRVSEQEGRYGAHVKFGELATEDELAIARFLDQHPLSKV